MPVTAKLSRRFYDQLGDDIANELVEWFNAVDATYKADLERLNDLNWERFRSEMRAQFAEFRAEMNAELAKLRAEMNAELAKLRAEMDRKFAEVDVRFAAQDARFDVRLANLRSELLKWMFAFWAGTVIPLAALIVGLAAASR